MLVQIDQTPSNPKPTSTLNHKLAQQIIKEIDDLLVEDNSRYRSRTVGASSIGHKCERYLWYQFRWFFREKFNGRMLRLFDRGHREEARFNEWLERT